MGVTKLASGPGMSSTTSSVAEVHAAAVAANNSAFRESASTPSSVAPYKPSATTTETATPPPQTPQTSPQGTPPNGDEVQCPHCTGKILTKKSARISSGIGGLLRRCFPIKLPTGLVKLLTDNAPVQKKAALKGSCKSCKGKGTIKDPAKLAAPAAEKVKAAYQKNAKEITELENKLAPHGGNRYTVIQGSEVLEVGLGFNDAPSYSVIEGAGRRNGRMVSDLSSKGAPMFFEGAESNYIQGINSVASPGGHYFVKCSNKFSVAAGVQGIDLTTGGPVTISGGITRISGPEITIGGQTGPLTLEGEVVYLNGKSVEVATSDGDFCVRGNISTTSNATIGGHTHSESVSFVNALCVGTKDGHTDEGSPNDFHTGPAFYGSAGNTAQSQVALDMAAFVASNTSSLEKIKNMMGPAYKDSLGAKIKNMAYQMTPYEQEVTGWIIPGTKMKTAVTDGTGVTITGTCTCPCNYGLTPATGPITITLGTLQIEQITQTVINNIELHNFPHSHVLPDLKHNHTIRLPDMDYSADNAEQLRGKIKPAISTPAPYNISTGKAKTLQAAWDAVMGATFLGSWNSFKPKESK